MSYLTATYDGPVERDEILAVLNWESRRTAAYLGVLNRVVAGELGLNPTDLDVLGLLTVTGTVTPTRLADFSGLGTGTVTLVLDRLEKAGFIQRTPDPHDRRSILIELVPGRGEEAAALYAPIQQAAERLLASYDDHDLALIGEYLRRSNDMLHEANTELLRRRAARREQPA